MKDPRDILGQTYLISCGMREMAMKTSGLVSTREDTEIMAKHLQSNYVNAYLEQVAANATHMSSYEITQLIGMLNKFEYLFNVTLVE